MAFIRHDPDISASAMIGVIWLETVLAAIVVVFRIWVRAHHPPGFSNDDVFIVFAMLCLVTMSALYTPIIPDIYLLLDLVDGKVTKPPADLIQRVTRFLRLQFAIIILFWTTLWCIKAAFLCLYKKFFSGTHGHQRRVWWVVVVFCFLTYVGDWALQFLACSPFATYFQLNACETERDIYISNISLYYSTAVDIACDLLIMALPMSILYNLNVTRSQKIGLFFLFFSGFVIIAFAVIRLILTLPTKTHVNPKWLCVLSMTECAVAIIVGCAPALRVYFRKASKGSGRHHMSHEALTSDRRAPANRSDHSSETAVSHSPHARSSVEQIGLAEMLKNPRDRIDSAYIPILDSPTKPVAPSAYELSHQPSDVSMHGKSLSVDDVV